MRRPMPPHDRIVVKLEARIADLERENAWLRQNSGSGSARCQIRQPPRLVWPVKAEPEEML